MKKFLFIIAVVLFCSKCYAQCVIARIDTVNAVIVHQYLSTGNNNYYCIKPTYLLLGKDTVLFYTDALYNKIFIKEYPHLESSTGKSSDYNYDVLEEVANDIYKHNVNFSPYNHLINSILESISLFDNLKNDDVLSVYNFYGTVVLYDGIKTKKYEVRYDSNADCSCNNSGYIETEHFAILKEVFELSPLSKEQIVDLQLLKSNLSTFRIPMCE